jgi:MFS family permease
MNTVNGHSKRIWDIIAFACLLNIFVLYSFYLPAVLMTEIRSAFVNGPQDSLPIFLIGFFFRPLGAYFFGSRADLVGRKKILQHSLFLMCAASIGIGLAPMHGMNWIYYILRGTQGFALGGCYSILAVLIYELAPSNRRGLFTGIMQMSVPIGYLSAVAFILVLRMVLGEDLLMVLGWRIAFSMAILILPIWKVLDKILVETMNQDESQRQGKMDRGLLPVVLAISVSIGAVAFGGVNYKFYFMKVLLGANVSIVNYIAAISTIIYAPFYLLWGYLSDKVSPLKIVISGAFLGAICIVPLFKAIEYFSLQDIAIQLGSLISYSGGGLLIATTLVSIIATICYGPMILMLCDVLPQKSRCRNFGLIYNISTGIFGGLVYFVGNYFYEKQGTRFGGVWFISALVTVCLLVSGALYLRMRLKKT